jgi:glycosyltransferase involved in cell wall biosynthesis
MKIGYDASGLVHPQTGVGTYIQQLLTHLLRIDDENAYWLLTHRHLAHVQGINGNGNSNHASPHFSPSTLLRSNLLPGTRGMNRLLWMQCVLPLTLRALDPDVVHFPNFVTPLIAQSNFVVTLHDVVLHQFPQWCSPRQRVLMRPLLRPSVERAHTIITVSEQSKRDIVSLFGVSPTRVRVIYEAAAPPLHEPLPPARARELLSKYGWNETARNLLYVGTLEVRKNLERLVGAVAQLHRYGLKVHLWLVGQPGWRVAAIRQRIEQEQLEAFVHTPGYVPFEDLRAFYQACDVFVFPSLYEGFGLPALEAMASGAAVVVSDIPALREVTGDAALRFDPLDEEALTETLRRVFVDEALAADLRTRARQRATEFSWERAARETLAVYQEVARTK